MSERPIVSVHGYTNGGAGSNAARDPLVQLLYNQGGGHDIVSLVYRPEDGPALRALMEQAEKHAMNADVRTDGNEVDFEARLELQHVYRQD